MVFNKNVSCITPQLLTKEVKFIGKTYENTRSKHMSQQQTVSDDQDENLKAFQTEADSCLAPPILFSNKQAETIRPKAVSKKFHAMNLEAPVNMTHPSHGLPAAKLFPARASCESHAARSGSIGRRSPESWTHQRKMLEKEEGTAKRVQNDVQNHPETPLQTHSFEASTSSPHLKKKKTSFGFSPRFPPRPRLVVFDQNPPLRRPQEPIDQLLETCVFRGPKGCAFGR